MSKFNNVTPEALVGELYNAEFKKSMHIYRIENLLKFIFECIFYMA